MRISICRSCEAYDSRSIRKSVRIPCTHGRVRSDPVKRQATRSGQILVVGCVVVKRDLLLHVFPEN